MTRHHALASGFVLALIVATTTAGSAQSAASKNAAAQRAQITELLVRGDLAGAQKIYNAATATAAAPAAAAAIDDYHTIFEEIKACGFKPQEYRLECVIQIKQTGGYGGPVGSVGSVEHVYFCIDWTNSGVYSQWNSVGQGSVHMHDESAGGKPPWNYAVFRDIDPIGGVRTSNSGATATTVTNAPTHNAKAILSWFSAPTGCNFVPFWGNVVQFPVRFDPIR